MEHVHKMKVRLAHELSTSCEEWLGEELAWKELKYLGTLAHALNEIHDACEMMHEMDEHHDKHMTDHYK